MAEGQGSPPLPPADFASRPLPVESAPTDTLYRIHRTSLGALHFGRPTDPARRQRWDSPDASYGVCYLAFEAHIAFAETMLRDLSIDTVQHEDLAARSLTVVHFSEPLRLVPMEGRHLRALRANASVIHGAYPTCWTWSAAIHAHPDIPDGITYRSRHDDSGYSVALFDRAEAKVADTTTAGLTDPELVVQLGSWLDRYGVGLTS